MFVGGVKLLLTMTFRENSTEIPNTYYTIFYLCLCLFVQAHITRTVYLCCACAIGDSNGISSEEINNNISCKSYRLSFEIKKRF